MTRPGGAGKRSGTGRVVLGNGARRGLPARLAGAGAARVLVVASRRAVEASGVHGLLSSLDTQTFSGFTPNPTLEAALAGSAALQEWWPDVIVAVGGGSAVDTAKLARGLPPDRDGALRVLAGDREPGPVRHVPLVALPTTAGSGSEVTSFATVYVDGVKASLEHPSVRPEHALVDPELLRTCPRWLLYGGAFEALCHAVESYWSTRSTPPSRRLSLLALRRLVPLLARELGAIDDGGRTALAGAATTAGRAIDVARTTAAHAFSYRLTARFGVPHGVACLLNLSWLFDHNVEQARAPGGGTLRARLATLARVLEPLGAAAMGGGALRALAVRGGFPPRLRDYGVQRGDLLGLVEAGLGSERSRNSPAELDHRAARERLSALL